MELQSQLSLVSRDDASYLSEGQSDEENTESDRNSSVVSGKKKVQWSEDTLAQSSMIYDEDVV